MPLSFWFGLALFVFSIFDLLSDHGDKVRCFRRTSGKERKNLACKIAKMWTVFLFSLGVIISSGFEYLSAKREAEDALRRIEANDPMNLPVSDISASATVTIAGPMGDVGQPGLGLDLRNWVMLSESNSPPNKLNLGRFQMLYLSDGRGYNVLSAGPTNHSFVLTFNSDRELTQAPYVIADRSPVTPKIILDRVNSLQFRLHVVPTGSEIIGGGTAEILIGQIRKLFTIPAQRCSTNGTFYATNSVSL